MDLNIDEIYTRMVKRGEAWAELNAAADLLEESRKSVRAQYAMEHMPTAKSLNKAELMAEADTRYQDHIKAMVEARKKANLAQVHYKASQVWADLLRSQESTRRAEMQNLKG